MIINLLRKIRSTLVRKTKPKEGYWLATRSLKPLSRKFGFDRGTPIDRYWIESFLKENKKFIKGICLEIGDNRYTQKFGKDQFTKSDVLDVNKSNKKANIFGNLKNLKNVIPDNTYDTIILTHVLGQIDDPAKAVSECKRILKIGGNLLVTSSSFSPTVELKDNYWRFTTTSFKYIFQKHFKKVFVKSYGNVLAGQAFWVGLAQEELTKKELEYNDPNFSCIVTAQLTKSKKQKLE